MLEWSPHRVIMPPTGTLLSVADGVAHIQGDSDDADLAAKVGAWIAAATALIQTRTSSKLLTQTVRLCRAEFDDCMPIPVGPIQSITSITYIDANGMQQTLDPSFYFLAGAGTLAPRIVRAPLQTWPTTRIDHPEAVTLTAVAGYGDTADTVPPELIQAILLLVGDWDANREDTIAERGVVPATLPNGIEMLIANYVVF